MVSMTRPRYQSGECAASLRTDNRPGLLTDTLIEGHPSTPSKGMRTQSIKGARSLKLFSAATQLG